MTNQELQNVKNMASEGKRATVVAQLRGMQHLPMKPRRAAPAAVFGGAQQDPLHPTNTLSWLQCCFQPDMPIEIAN